MKRFAALTALSAFALCQHATAAVIQEFLFNDPAGTNIVSVANTAPGGDAWYDDLQGDLAGLATNGLGQYATAAKTNLNTGDAFLAADPDITTGAIYGVMDLTWAFDVASYNAAEPEEVRLTLLGANTSGSSTVTAEFAIVRSGASSLSFSGTAVGTGSSNVTGVALPNLVQSQKFIAVVAAGLDKDVYNVSFSADGGATFTTLPGGTLDAARGFLQARMRINNDVSQDAVLIDRVAFFDSNPYPGLIPSVPEPVTATMAAIGAALLACNFRRTMGR
jgi:hypothetical protein